MENDHLTIGKVSNITNISERRLRYYDQLGLCSPAYRDPNTGYRYYTSGQIPRLRAETLRDLMRLLRNFSKRKISGR